MDNSSITYTSLGTTDIQSLTELINIYVEVFDTENFSMPDTKYLQNLLERDFTIFCVARLNNVVIGGLTAYILPSVYYSSSQVYIYDLAITQNMQRQGVGKGIISFLKKYCKDNGYGEIYVQAELEDQHAIEFYKATGGHPEKVIHFSYDLTS